MAGSRSYATSSWRLRALEVSPGRAHLFPIAQAGRAIEVRIAEFSAFGQVVRNLTGLSAFGCEFARRKEEIEGISPAEWRPVIPREKNEWPTHVAELNWSGLANAARERQDGRLYLVAGSVKSQCRFSATRLLDLSDIYHRNLLALLRSKDELRSDIRYSPPFYNAIFSSIHAAFFEIATLRDYLAEYLAAVLYGQDAKIDKFSELHRYVRKRSAPTPLERTIASIYAEDGWLRGFSDRRNTIAHRMPFTQLAGARLMHVKEAPKLRGIGAWMLHLPVPYPVPIDYKSTYVLPSDPIELAKSITGDRDAGREREDTLSYLFGIFERLLEFANSLSGTFPYEPTMFTITDEMILDHTMTKGGN